MRRHLQPVPDSVHTLSIEEEAILADEVNQHVADITDSTTDVERLGDIIVTVGDVQTIVSNTPELGEVEQDLIGSVADMAVAGTDIDPEQFVEDVLPVQPTGGISAEGVTQSLKETMARIWEGIKNAILKMWEHVKKFFAHIGDFITGTKRRVAKLEELVKAGVKFSGQPGTFSGRTELLLVEKKAPSNLAVAYKKMVATGDNALIVTRTHGITLIQHSTKLFDKIATDIDKVDRNVDTYLTPLFSEFMSLKKGLRMGGQGPLANSCITTEHGLGNFGFTGDIPVDTNGKNFNEALEGATGFNLVMINPDKSTTVKLSLTTDTHIIDSVLEDAKDWLTTVEMKARDVAAVDKEATHARNELDGLVKKMKDADQVTPEMKKRLSVILSINGRINAQVARLLHGVVYQGNSITNAVLDYCIESCQPGKAAPAK